MLAGPSRYSDRRTSSVSTFIHRVILKNYKSIAACDVRLAPLTFLVGPNGAGKSNFLDALRLVSDALRTSLDHAVRDRGGINEVRRRSSGHPNHFGIRLEFRFEGMFGHYAFNVGAKDRGAYEIQNEECLLHSPNSRRASFRVRAGEVEASTAPVPPASKDRLYLVNASGLPEFRPLYDALSQMGFYNLNPEAIRDVQSPDAGDLLARDGSNLASVLARLEAHDPAVKQRVEEYLEKVVPGVQGVEHKTVGPKETIEFKQEVAGAKHPWKFLATNMSDGTLRALAVLVALFQPGRVGQGRTRLVGLEEPESALHPAAAGVLIDCLRDAAEHCQVIVTSHSPDLLDAPDISDDQLIAVLSEQNETKLGRLDAGGRDALKQGLYTAGELLRMNQLQPDEEARKLDPEQLKLFGDDA